jgi:hypothetical protein
MAHPQGVCCHHTGGRSPDAKPEPPKKKTHHLRHQKPPYGCLCIVRLPNCPPPRLLASPPCAATPAEPLQSHAHKRSPSSPPPPTARSLRGVQPDLEVISPHPDRGDTLPPRSSSHGPPAHVNATKEAAPTHRSVAGPAGSAARGSSAAADHHGPPGRELGLGRHSTGLASA